MANWFGGKLDGVMKGLKDRPKMRPLRIRIFIQGFWLSVILYLHFYGKMYIMLGAGYAVFEM